MSETSGISPILLRSFSDLDDLSDNALAGLAKVLIPMSVSAGETFLQFGNKESYLFLIQSGTIGISTKIQHDIEPLVELTEYQMFGHSALFRQSSRMLQCKAIEDSSLYVIPRHMHQWALERGASWAIELQRCLGVLLVQQLRHAMNTLQEKVDNPPEDTYVFLKDVLGYTDFSIPSDIDPT